MKQPKEVLKTYFETGDKPTQQQFSDLIDSFFHLDNGVVITNISGSESGDTIITLSDGTKITINRPPDNQSENIYTDGISKTDNIVSLGGEIADGSYPEIPMNGNSGFYIYSNSSSELEMSLDNIGLDSSFAVKAQTSQVVGTERFALGFSYSGGRSNDPGIAGTPDAPVQLKTQGVVQNEVLIGQVPVLTSLESRSKGNVEFRNTVHDVVAGNGISIDKSDPFNPVIESNTSGYTGSFSANGGATRVIIENGIIVDVQEFT